MGKTIKQTVHFDVSANDVNRKMELPISRRAEQYAYEEMKEKI